MRPQRPDSGRILRGLELGLARHPWAAILRSVRISDDRGLPTDFSDLFKFE